MRTVYDLRRMRQVPTGDDRYLPIVRGDMSGGQNTRISAHKLAENQAEKLNNCDIGIPGQFSKRYGSMLIGNDLGSASIVAMHNFVVDGAVDQLLTYQGATLSKWTGSGNHATIKNDFTGTQTDVHIITGRESGISPDTVVFVSNGSDNVFRIDADGNEQDLGDTSTSPPIGGIPCWYANRVWILKSDLLYYSDAYSADYSGAFDRTNNNYRVPVGDARFLIPTRDLGLVCGGAEGVWAVDPSSTPAATDSVVPLVTSWGAVVKSAVNYADDIYFFADDGFRSLKRTVQDKLQAGVSYPLSYGLKTAYEAISWAYISRLRMIGWDNRIFISVPTGASSFDTWVYYIPLNTMNVYKNLNISSWTTFKVSGEERLFYGKYGDGKVYWAFDDTLFTDEGTTQTNGSAIEMTWIGRKEDFGMPLEYKVGGDVEIEALSTAASETLTVKASVDGASYITLGTVALAEGTAPTLPVSLPFTLADTKIIRKKLDLSNLGRFRTIQFQITHTDTNTELITILGINVTTFKEEYENE